MVLNIHSDASYLSESRARSRIGGIYFLGQVPRDGQVIQLNGPIHVQASICKFVVASAAKAELGALFYNCQDGKIFRLVLTELGHAQPPTPVHCDNSTAVSIANDTVKKQRSRAMEMILLGNRSSTHWKFQCHMAPRTRESGGLLHKTL